VAALLLAVLTLGAGALILRSRADILVQKYKRAAIETANMRMEELLRNTDYSTLAAMAPTTVVQTVALNNRPGFTMTTTLADAGSEAENCLWLTVSVAYEPGGGDAVTLEMLRSK